MSDETKNALIPLEDNEQSVMTEKFAIYKKALEEIRDLPLEPSNSPRMTDQLWHFVRWSKSIARNALDKKVNASK
jgi:hypothetical protein